MLQKFLGTPQKNVFWGTIFLLFIFALCSVYDVIEIHTLLQLQDLGSKLIEFWNLMDTPDNERRCFDHVTSLIKVSPNTAMPEGCLAHDLIEKVIIYCPFPLNSYRC